MVPGRPTASVERARRVRITGALAAAGGAAAAYHYYRLGLALSHYDARAHLVVARRIFDSITPGWQQIGAVWLPVPHLLNALPIQIDLFYRTGASAIAFSVAAFAIATASILWIVDSLTDSPSAGVVAAAIFAFNPNVLYLQATPMAELLLVATMLVAIALLIDWCGSRPAGPPESGHHGRTKVALNQADNSRRVGLAFAVTCLTRYEAWPVTVAACVAAVWARWRQGESLRVASRAVAAIALYPTVAIFSFSVFSRIVSGSWFPDDFYVAENVARGRPYEAIKQIVWGVRELSGDGLLMGGVVGVATGVVAALMRGTFATLLIPVALVGSAAIPWAAFVGGHPYRIRYMVPLLAAQAVLSGIAAGLPKRFRIAAIAALAVVVVFELRPLDQRAPMVVEAQWDRPNFAARDQVTACLASNYDGTTIMVSLGSLSHYVQDLSRNGFGIRDFLHEGNGDIWLNALNDPRPFAGWILIEELAEGGDMLARRARDDPKFLAGFSRTCEAAGLVLYRRKPLHGSAPPKP